MPPTKKISASAPGCMYSKKFRGMTQKCIRLLRKRNTTCLVIGVCWCEKMYGGGDFLYLVDDGVYSYVDLKRVASGIVF